MTPPASTTALEAVLGIERPIVGAPTRGTAGALRAAAISDCGALGFVRGDHGDLGWLDDIVAAIDPTTVGVGLLTWWLDEQPTMLDHVLAVGPRAVWLSGGDPVRHHGEIRSAGVAAVSQVHDRDAAMAARDAGAQVIVVQGGDGVGERPGRGLFSLLPAVVARVGDAPVVAAGGIATGRQLAASWCLGAAGIAVGPRLDAADLDLRVQWHGDAVDLSDDVAATVGLVRAMHRDALDI